ncbi:retropepsin-like aspartic protease [Zunongwangia sp. HRR-M8]|uniref:retropepsin-like aspartic protease n=1 Tax=Zunongwangia sp. HRR-M8 TaxID=3015170 RepID=UPI0022DD5082|nr:retropepsin-like aspartic protease [Zunongwangia sp. HRR-M8]WBL23038.1 retropepsin-like aspartic protease [Zunongwangia sp. HRR-M8]
MKKAVLVVTFLLISSVFFAQNYSEEKIEIPFKLSPNGHIMIKASVNGVTGNFVFDTGAGLNLLTKDFADKIDNLKKTNHFYTGHRATGEAITTDLYDSERLEIGDFNVKNEQFAVYDIDFPLDGLISLTPLRQKAFTIDFVEKKLIVESKKSLQQREKNQDFEMPLEINNDRNIKVSIGTMVKIDSLKLHVGLDSGAGFDVFRFNSRYMEALGIDSTKVESKYIPSSFKPEQGNQYYRAEIGSFGDLKMNAEKTDFQVTFIDGLIHEGIMGINWIGEVITFDMPKKKIVVRNNES